MNENKIQFVILKNTKSISLTEDKCYLNCNHCNKHYLKNMKTIKDISNLYEEGFTSFLISGGYNINYKIPLKENFDELTEFKKTHKIKYNIHTGLVEEKDIETIKFLHDKVSFDLVGSEKTYKDVYNINKFNESWKSFDLLLKNEIEVVPHITIGLNRGKISHESEALKRLHDYKEKISEIIFLVFIPTKGSNFQNAIPCKIEEVENIILKAKDLFEDKTLTLGCMHPKGLYRKDLQETLLGKVNKMVQPLKTTINKAKNEKYEIYYSYECCAL
jgi:hypothetical protein